ncbi:hypothetical protein JR316_0010952 [Psilocybe cubensis]|uniref:Uncharacterized protein n=1 Tax=Psilocybe cubensis TaxID=181762 RepID=A0ACB8GMY3_PSICU|nr:hypothetical protein JR316_0010952 [Psilocybe cubensis]KAH9477036.1 hypothetical protein JR316_0010952 [Psilocybe cubensis]
MQATSDPTKSVSLKANPPIVNGFVTCPKCQVPIKADTFGLSNYYCHQEITTYRGNQCRQEKIEKKQKADKQQAKEQAVFSSFFKPKALLVLPTIFAPALVKSSAARPVSIASIIGKSDKTSKCL